jgi:hypothetical protein
MSRWRAISRRLRVADRLTPTVPHSNSKKRMALIDMHNAYTWTPHGKEMGVLCVLFNALGYETRPRFRRNILENKPAIIYNLFYKTIDKIISLFLFLFYFLWTLFSLNALAHRKNHRKVVLRYILQRVVNIYALILREGSFRKVSQLKDKLSVS